MKISISDHEAYPVYSWSSTGPYHRDFDVPQETLDRWLAAEKLYDQAQEEMGALLESKKLKDKEEQFERDRIEVARLRANALARQKDNTSGN